MSVNTKELLEEIFPLDVTEVTIFDASDEKVFTDFDVDEDALLLEMPEARLAFDTDGLVYAIASKDLTKEKANFWVTKNDSSFGIYILEQACALDDVPEYFSVDAPLPFLGRKAEYGVEEYHTLDSLIQMHAVDTSDDAVEYINDAEIRGDKSLKLGDFLDQKMVFMTGDLYPSDNRKSTKDGEWRRVEKSLIQWIEGGEGWGFSRHPVGKSKSGASLVPSENIDGARKDSAVKTMYAIGIDIDSGTKIDHVLSKLEEAGIFAMLYSTFNHRTTHLELKHDDVMRKMGIKESPNRTQIQEYLRIYHDTRFDRDFINDIEVVEFRKQTKDGMRVILKVPPIDKFRVIIPLEKPVELSDLAPTLSEWKDVWANAVTGVCKHLLETTFDSSSVDVNRLFYIPKHAKGSEWYSAIVMGNPLKFEDIKPFSKTQYLKEREPLGDPFMAGAENDVESFTAPSGMNLNGWHTRAKDRFLMADVLETYCPDKTRNVGGERAGTVHVECPFEHEHSSTGGTATLAMNPEANEHEIWSVFCKHDSCSGRNKLEFLQRMLEDEWFEETVLKDEGFLLPEELEEEIEEEKNARPAVDQAEEFTENSSEEEIYAFVKKQHRIGADKTTRNAVKQALADKTLLEKRDIEAMWRKLDKEKISKEAEKAASDLDSYEGYPVVNLWDYKKMRDWGEKRIQAHNAKIPTLFHYMDGVARVRQNARGQWHIHILNKDEFASELNRMTTWNHQTMMGDQVKMRGVSAPDDVVRHIFSDVDAVYPPLRGVVTSPTFTKTGEMITTRGYHESGLYYEPDITLDIPKVNEAPSEEEVAKAVRLIVEEALADFPFAGNTREEIVDKVLDGEGIPAVTHCLSLLLILFCRDMITGSIPAGFLSKPNPGVGASLLTDVVSLIGTGTVTPASAMPGSSEEMGKVLTAMLASGTNIIYFDNIPEGVDSAELASALTSTEYKARILGKTELVDTEVRCAFILTGNNVQLSGEIMRRCILVDLDAQVAEPEKRTGWKHDDIRNWVRKNRGELVWACLTIIQNWIAKGKVPYKDEVLNSFENWSSVMGGIMRDANIKGFLGNREELKALASDGKEMDVTMLLEEWWRAYASKWTYSRQHDEVKDSIIGLALAADVQLNVRKALDAEGQPTYNTMQFETFLGKYNNRVFILSDGTEVRLERSSEPAKHGNKWRLAPKTKVVSNVPD